MKRALFSYTLLALSGAPLKAMAAGYGIYDARTQALGGAGVALGNSRIGFYYNPALMALGTQSKNKGKNSTFYLPSLVAEVTQGARDAEKINRSALDKALTDAINTFNRDDFSAASAAKGVDAADAINRAIDTLNQRNLSADAYAGLAVALPGAGEGGAVFMGSRLVGAGFAEIKSADRELLNKYSLFLRYVADKNTLLGAPTAGIFDANAGGLIDPTLNNSITSSATFRGAALSELGIAFSGSVPFHRARLALGLSPKVVQANVIDAQQRVVSNGLASEWEKQSRQYMNFDTGAVLVLNDHYHLGFAIKDVISKHFTSLQGNDIPLTARYRLGAAYQHVHYSLGLEADLRPSSAFAGEKGRQDLAIGAEYRPWRFLDVRAGYRLDTHGDAGGTYSMGFGVNVWGFTTDIAYAKGKEGEGVGLQWGKRF